MVTRILALIIMGVVGIFTIAMPIGMLGSAGVGFIILLLLTAAIAFTGHSSSVWSRLCLVNGLAALALPLFAIALSAMFASSGAINRASFAAGGTRASDAGAQVGAVLGGVMLTGAAAFVGFVVGAIFLILAYALRSRGARSATTAAGLALLAVTFAAPPALAQGMPGYDIKDTCRNLAGGNYAFEKSCRESEGKSREQVRRAPVDPDVWANCNRLSGDSGTYSFLQACINSESGAKRQLGYAPSQETVTSRGRGGQAGAAPAGPIQSDLCPPSHRMTERDGCQPRR